jgi:hypothetical protein
MGLEFAERIGHFDGGFAGGEAALDERVGDAFVPAAGGEGVAQAEQAVVGAVGVGDGMEAGDDAGGNAVESVQPGDFLDEIDFAGEIVAEGGRLPDGFVVVPVESFSQPSWSGFPRWFRGNFDAEQACDFFRTERDGAASGRRLTGDGGGRGNRRAGQLDEQGQGAVAGGEQRAGIDAAFVAVGGIGDEAEPAAGAAHGGGEEPGGFEDDFGGGFGDAGRLAAHDARDGDGAGARRR